MKERSFGVTRAKLERALRSLTLGIALALWPGAGSAVGGSLVEVSNISEAAPRLLGYLVRPTGEGPFPAVVVLHGCGGFGSHSAGIADTLGSWGYVALAIDSLGPRGFNNHCGSFFLDQAFDAYAALRFLAQQEYVASERIAVLGQSMGGASTVSAVDRDMAAQYFTERFAAAIAYYPGCDLAAVTLTTPTLILIGEADDWTPADRCREMVAHARPDSAPIALAVYPGAYHAFDVTRLQSGRRYRDHWIEYNEPAARDAEEKTRIFLSVQLGKTSPGSSNR